MVLYADVLFCIDFSMDAVALYMTGKFTNSRTSVVKLALSASIGAAGSVAMTVFGIKPTIYYPVLAVLSYLMCGITFGKWRLRHAVNQTLILWGGGLLLGGVMTALMSLGNYEEYRWNSTQGSTPDALFLFGIIPAVVIFTSLGRLRASKTADIEFELGGTHYRTVAIVDSGNLLSDPFTGEPVIILSRNDLPESVLQSIESLEKGEEPLHKVRMIPASSISGNTMLYGVRPERLSVNGISRSAVVAGGTSELSDSIVPSVLL